MAEVNDVLIWSGTEWLSLEGPQGQPGQSATVDVGTTTTGAAGSDAAVENVGSTSAAVFNFTIPTGAKGPDGEAGTQQVGTVTTNQLNAGSNATVVINNSGDATNAVWDYTFSLAAGADGKDGNPGQDGTGIQIKGQLQVGGNPVAGPPTGDNTLHIGDWSNDGPGDAYLDVNGDLWVWESQFNYVDVGSIQGPPGENGQDGQPGNAATVSATASANQVACDQAASVVVTNNGDANAAQFAFAFDLPQGCDGAQGDPGKDGANAEVFVQSGTPVANAPGALWLKTSS